VAARRPRSGFIDAVEPLEQVRLVFGRDAASRGGAGAARTVGVYGVYDTWGNLKTT
jgi:hypothetical protein